MSSQKEEKKWNKREKSKKNWQRSKARTKMKISLKILPQSSNLQSLWVVTKFRWKEAIRPRVWRVKKKETVEKMMERVKMKMNNRSRIKIGVTPT